MDTSGEVTWTVPDGEGPGGSTYEVQYERGNCMAVGSGTVTVVPPTTPDNQPPVIGNIASVFLDNVPEDGDWFVSVSITDDNDDRSDLTIGAQVVGVGIGASASVTTNGIMISTTGLLDVGTTFDVEITAADTEGATSVRTFGFTIA